MIFKGKIIGPQKGFGILKKLRRYFFNKSFQLTVKTAIFGPCQKQNIKTGLDSELILKSNGRFRIFFGRKREEIGVGENRIDSVQFGRLQPYPLCS